jgi:hypothetical protein
VYTHESVGVFTRTPFFPIQPGGLNFSADEWSTWGCLAVFPGHKGRTNLSIFFYFDCLVALFLLGQSLHGTDYDYS